MATFLVTAIDHIFLTIKWRIQPPTLTTETILLTQNNFFLMKIFFFLPIPVGRLLFRTNYCRWRRCRRWCRCWRQRRCWRRRKMLKIAFTCRNEFTSQVFLHVTSTSFQSSHLAFVKISSAIPECHIKLQNNDDWYLLATSSIFPCNTTGSGANLCPNRTIKIHVHGITRRDDWFATLLVKVVSLGPEMTIMIILVHVLLGLWSQLATIMSPSSDFLLLLFLPMEGRCCI